MIPCDQLTSMLFNMGVNVLPRSLQSSRSSLPYDKKASSSATHNNFSYFTASNISSFSFLNASSLHFYKNRKCEKQTSASISHPHDDSKNCS